MDIEKMSLTIAKAASDKKARDVIRMKMTEVSTEADYFIICTGNTSTQVRAIADNIEEDMLKAGISFLHREGYRESDWVLLDYGDCVVHIFTPDSREFYALERLWGDAELIPYED